MQISHVTVTVYLYSQVKFLANYYQKMEKMNKSISVSLIYMCLLPEHMCNYRFIKMKIQCLCQWYQSQCIKVSNQCLQKQ